MTLLGLVEPVRDHRLITWVVLYVGPDVLMPLMSALAAAAGFVLMFWRRVVDLFRRAFGRESAETLDSPREGRG